MRTVCLSPDISYMSSPQRYGSHTKASITKSRSAGRGASHCSTDTTLHDVIKVKTKSENINPSNKLIDSADFMADTI